MKWFKVGEGKIPEHEDILVRCERDYGPSFDVVEAWTTANGVVFADHDWNQLENVTHWAKIDSPGDEP